MVIETPEILRDEVQRQIVAIGSADLLVGIPSYNNARTVAHVVRAVSAGLAKYFPDHRAVLVNSDGGSTDGTPEIVAHAEFSGARAILVSRPPRHVHRVVTAYQGMPGKGSAFRTIMEVARRLGVRACAVVDSDLRSITPEWIQLLLGPILGESFEYVCPLYSRHKYDGTITNAIVYPMVAAAYGRRIRQPIGGDFGFSGDMASRFLEQDVWDTDVARFGVDIWMTTTALQAGVPVCQAYLGAKIHDAKDPGQDLSAMLVQVTGSLFGQLEAHAPSWYERTGSDPVPTFGFEYEVGLEPIPVHVDRMVTSFARGVEDFDSLYRQIFRQDTREAIRSIPTSDPERFSMPPDVWVRIVYEIAAAYRHRVLPRDHVLRTLPPLYLGRTVSWVNEARSYGAPEVERSLDELRGRFEALKPYFIELWTKGGSPP